MDLIILAVDIKFQTRVHSRSYAWSLHGVPNGLNTNMGERLGNGEETTNNKDESEE